MLLEVFIPEIPFLQVFAINKTGIFLGNILGQNKFEFLAAYFNNAINFNSKRLSEKSGVRTFI